MSVQAVLHPRTVAASASSAACRRGRSAGVTVAQCVRRQGSTGGDVPPPPPAPAGSEPGPTCSLPRREGRMSGDAGRPREINVRI